MHPGRAFLQFLQAGNRREQEWKLTLFTVTAGVSQQDADVEEQTMPSQPHPRGDMFQDEVTTRYTFVPDEVQHPMPSVDAIPSSQRPGEQGVSQIFSMRPPSTPPPPPVNVELVPLHIMRQLVAEFAEFIGPAAKPVVVSEVVSLRFGPDRFPVSQFPLLAERLVRRLDTSHAAQRFVERLRTLHPCLAKLHA